MTRALTCRELAEFLDDYLEGGLSETERARFDVHLGVCGACVSYLASYRETVRLGRRASARDDRAIPGDVPEGLIQAILAAGRC
jgi:anti-sigma factor RsiW